jgi:hypothetical protein
MADNATGSNVDGECAHRVAARWASSCHRNPPGVDRDAMAAALLAALDGTALGAVALARQSALFGAHLARIGASIAGLIDELDRLESAALDHIAADTPAKPVDEVVHSIRQLHSQAAFARRAAIAAFGQTVSSEDRQRVRIARHDIANAIGTVRNAILLMEDEINQGAREHFRAIARRNSLSSEALVRSHLSDQNALTPALGWEALSSSAVLAAGDQDGRGANVVANVAAAEVVVELICAIGEECGRGGTSTVAFAGHDESAATLTITLAVADDRFVGDDVVSGLRELAATFGLRLDGDVQADDLRLIVPLSPRNQGHDFGGVRQGEHANAVGF